VSTTRLICAIAAHSPDSPRSPGPGSNCRMVSRGKGGSTPGLLKQGSNSVADGLPNKLGKSQLRLVRRRRPPSVLSPGDPNLDEVAPRHADVVPRSTLARKLETSLRDRTSELTGREVVPVSPHLRTHWEARRSSPRWRRWCATVRWTRSGDTSRSSASSALAT